MARATHAPRGAIKAKPGGNGKAGLTARPANFPIGAPPSAYPALTERFTSKVRVDDFSGCWMWTAATDRRGYGRFGRGGRRAGVARAYAWAWEAVHAPVPTGQTLDHLCRRPGCCNPAHLEVVMFRENIRRGLAANHDTCRRGLHAWTPENILTEGNGVKRCRLCRNQWERAQFAGVAPAQRTHCPRGHAYDEANTRRKAGGGRDCRTCHRDRAREKYRAAMVS